MYSTCDVETNACVLLFCDFSTLISLFLFAVDFLPKLYYPQVDKYDQPDYQNYGQKADKAKILYETLNEKERKIIEAVKAGAGYQAKIMNETNIPKASLSRYINNLIKKEFLIRKGEGKLAEIKLK